MEIRVERRVTGQAWRDEILARPRGRAALARKARAGDKEAAHAVWMLERLEEEPQRLTDVFDVATVFVLSPGDVQRLTPARFRLLDELARRPGSNLAALTRALGRDKKNVSEDIRFLEEIHMVASEARGREKSVRLTGHEIRIVVDA